MKKALCAILSLFFTFSAFCGASVADGTPRGEFHTDLMLEYIARAGDDLEAIYDYAAGDSEKSLPDPIYLEFWDDGVADSEWYVFQKSPYPDFSECETVTGLALKEYELNNPYLGEHFYWRGGSDLETIVDSPVHEMTVSSLCPRVCYVDGVTNVRDVGGYDSSLVSGGKIRQGLYYRGANLNSLTSEGLSTLYDQLGVRTEIDLRDADHYRPYVKGFESIAYYNPRMSGGDRFAEYADEYKTVFELVSRAAESPVYLHCQAGADRTGICTFMLLTVCGVSYHDVAFDYLWTNFSTMGPRHLDSGDPNDTDVFNRWYERLGNFEGETKAEQAKSWIMSKGVSEATVEIIRETFVEGYESDYLKENAGDANGDGRINAKDVTAVMKAIVGKSAPGYIERLADANGDGKINAKDVSLLMKRIVSE